MRAIVLSLCLAGILAVAGCGGADGDQTLPGGFVAPQLPTLTGVVPGVGSPAGGTPITLTGTNFTAAATVQVGGAAATGVNFVNTTTLTALTPPGTGTVDVTVSTIFGSATLPDAFTYGPAVTAVVPPMGPEAGGTAITITGSNFAAPASVTVGGNAALGVLVANPTTITCVTPPGVGVGDVKVTTAGGTATLAAAFTYIPGPTLTAVTPNRGTTDGGTPITLTGTGFVNNAAGPNAVTVGGLPCGSIVTVDDTTITCVTPPGPAGPADVVVSNANGMATLVGGFAYVLPVLYAADGRDGNAGNLYRIDPTTAAATVVGPMGVPITGLAFHPNGTLYAVESAQRSLATQTPPPTQPLANPRLFTVNTSTGQLTVVGPLVDAANDAYSVADITFFGSRLMGVSRSPGGQRLVEINVATGLITPTANNAPTVFGMGNVAADAVGTIFWARYPADSGELFTLDPGTGAPTQIVSTSGYVDPGTSPRWNASTFLGGVYYLNATSCRIQVCGGSAALVTMDPTTGVATLVGTLPLGVDALAGTVP